MMGEGHAPTTIRSTKGPTTMADHQQADDPQTDAGSRAADQVRTDRHEAAQAHSGGHGHSMASWVAVGVVMLGCLVMSIAVVAALVWLFVVGAVVVVVGMVLGKVLHGMGFGEKGSQQSPTTTNQGVR